MYFQNFPLLPYQFAGDKNFRAAVDIIKRVKVRDTIISTNALYQVYNVRDGETPEVLAGKYYNDTGLHWIILLTNSVIDPYFGWPLHSNVLKEFVKNKYLTAHIYDTHHYELVSPYTSRNGMYMPTPAEFADFDPVWTAKLYNADLEQIVPITNYEYETAVNDAKRSIKLFSPVLVPEFIKEFSSLVVE